MRITVYAVHTYVPSTPDYGVIVTCRYYVDIHTDSNVTSPNQTKQCMPAHHNNMSDPLQYVPCQPLHRSRTHASGTCRLLACKTRFGLDQSTNPPPDDGAHHYDHASTSCRWQTTTTTKAGAIRRSRNSRRPCLPRSRRTALVREARSQGGGADEHYRDSDNT